MPWVAQSRKRRGQRSYQSGLAAEDAVARRFVNSGAKILGRRVRTPYGELDLVVEMGGFLIFVEVKARRTSNLWDSPISVSQWQRLKNAAVHYMVPEQGRTGIQPACRFDVALVDARGQVTVYENACSFDEH